MPIDVAVHVSYPETGNYNWYNALVPYAEVGAVEVAFYRPEPFLERVEVAGVIAPFATLPLQVTTVHMAHAGPHRTRGDPRRVPPAGRGATA
jgi:hypothetical protein